jgi:hypothetical protein
MLKPACLTAWALLLAGGCAGPAPLVEVVGATVGELTSEAARIDLELRLVNRGSEPVRLRTFAYRLAVGGATVYAGRHSAEATLDRGIERRLVIPAVVSLEDTGGAGLVRYRVHGSVEYLERRRIAEILFDATLRRPQAGFEGEGQVALTPPG